MTVTTLPFGRKLPGRGDKGDPVFDALETNINLDDSHDHDGTDSDRIDTFNLSRSTTVAVTNSGWTGPDANGFYTKTVTFPAGHTLANGSQYRKSAIRFYLNGAFAGAPDQSEVFPRYERLSDTTITLYSPVNNQAYHVEFL